MSLCQTIRTWGDCDALCYDDLVKKASKHGKLWEDNIFPADGSSIEEVFDDSQVEWKRPHELVMPKEPTFFSPLSTNVIVTQGSGCNTDLKTAMFYLTCSSMNDYLEPLELFNKIVPDYKSQNMSLKRKLCGVFAFNLWSFDQWVQVIVDDRLPTHNNKLLFTRTTGVTENGEREDQFWMALLEKAMAKRYGSYSKLKSVELCDILEDLTGGVSMNILTRRVGPDWSEAQQLMRHDLLHREYIRGSIMLSKLDDMPVAKYSDPPSNASSASRVTTLTERSINSGKSDQGSMLRWQSITRGKPAYTFSQFQKCFSGRLEDMMVCVKNIYDPWDRGTIPAADILHWADDAGQRGKGPGGFVLTFSNLVKHFSFIVLCRSVPTSVEKDVTSNWYGRIMRGTWRCKRGRPSKQFTFLMSRDHEVLLQLQRKRETGLAYTMTLKILECEINRDTRINDLSMYEEPEEYTSNRRSLNCHVFLPSGRYVLIPAPQTPVNGRFVLRIFERDMPSVAKLRYPLVYQRLLFFRKARPMMQSRVVLEQKQDQDLSKLQDEGQLKMLVRCNYLRVTCVISKPKHQASVLLYRLIPLRKPISLFFLDLDGWEIMDSFHINHQHECSDRQTRLSPASGRWGQFIIHLAQSMDIHKM